MRRIYIKKSILDYVVSNKWQVVLLGLALLAGVSVGSLIAVSMKTDTAEATTKYLQNLISAYNLQTVNSGIIFRSALYNNIKVVLFLCLSSIWHGFIPFAVLQIALKGYKLGFTIALSIKTFGIRGIAFALLTSITQIAMFIPAVLIYTVFCINVALLNKKVRLGRVSVKKNEIYIKCFLALFLVALVSLAAAFVDAYVIPAILKPICSGLSV